MFSRDNRGLSDEQLSRRVRERQGEKTRPAMGTTERFVC